VKIFFLFVKIALHPLGAASKNVGETGGDLARYMRSMNSRAFVSIEWKKNIETISSEPS
jgi:hypothetical protein